MGNLLSSNSTNSTPRLYEGITLLLADPEKQFPKEFDPQSPFKVKKLKKTSRETFCTRVANENGVAVVAVENFNPTGLEDEPPEYVDLHDRATYIIVPRDNKTTERRFESIEAWQKNGTSGDERMLVARATKYLEDSGHAANIEPFCLKRITGPGDRGREIDAAAIADNCAVVIEHKNIMDAAGAIQLATLVDFIESNKDKGKGSVSQFSGKRIIGVLAGTAETKNVESRKDMDAILQGNGFLKWFEQAQYGDDPCSIFQASGASRDGPAPTSSPGNGPTAPAAMPRRVGRLLAPMRGSAMLVHPRLANRVASCRPSF